MSLCECGCGQDAGVYKYSDKTFGAVKGQPKKFVIGHRKNKREVLPTNLCACGCGRDAGRYSGDGGSSKEGAPKRFLKGHHKNPVRTQCRKGHPQIPENRLSSGYCKLCSRIASAAYKERHPEVVKGGHFKARYGVSREQFEDKRAAQENRCAICSVEFDYITRDTTPTLDHAHDVTNRFRGVLCSVCNAGLGMFKDNINVLEKAIQYLKETQWNQFKASFSDTVTKPEVEKTSQLQPSLPSEGICMTFAASGSQTS